MYDLERSWALVVVDYDNNCHIRNYIDSLGCVLEVVLLGVLMFLGVLS